jgi:hypothetical protein
MAKYKALFLLWSPSQERHIHPGEEFDILDNDIADTLLEKGVIEPVIEPVVESLVLKPVEADDIRIEELIPDETPEDK